MDQLRFEWDAQKGVANFKKHGVAFEEAKSVFYDERARLIQDPDHSQGEDRYVLIGLSARSRILVVCHCYQSSRGIIRIIFGPQGHGKGGKFLSVR
jgi:uncharacterized DUF497 family protein